MSQPGLPQQGLPILRNHRGGPAYNLETYFRISKGEITNYCYSKSRYKNLQNTLALSISFFYFRIISKIKLVLLLYKLHVAIKYKHSDTYSMYYCTFTCYQWISLFELTDSYDLVYKWFLYLRQKKIADSVAYIIMPNHLHFILYFANAGFNLNKAISNAKTVYVV